MATLHGRGLKTYSAKTADYTVVADTDTGKIFANTGASGTITFSLPAATVGENFDFYVGAAQALHIDPNGTETISLATGVQQAAGKYVTNSTVGGSFRIVCLVAGTWTCTGSVGTWTVEP